MRARDTEEVWLCQDCTIAFEYGAEDARVCGAPDGHAEAFAAGLDRMLPDVNDAYLVSDMPRDEETEDAWHDDFSTRACDLCATHLAGDRYRHALVSLYLGDDLV